MSRLRTCLSSAIFAGAFPVLLSNRPDSHARGPASAAAHSTTCLRVQRIACCLPARCPRAVAPRSSDRRLLAKRAPSAPLPRLLVLAIALIVHVRTHRMTRRSAFHRGVSYTKMPLVLPGRGVRSWNTAWGPSQPRRHLPRRSEAYALWKGSVVQASSLYGGSIPDEAVFVAFTPQVVGIARQECRRVHRRFLVESGSGSTGARPRRRSGERYLEDASWERGHLARGDLGSRLGGISSGGTRALPGPAPSLRAPGSASTAVARPAGSDPESSAGA